MRVNKNFKYKKNKIIYLYDLSNLQLYDKDLKYIKNKNHISI